MSFRIPGMGGPGSGVTTEEPGSARRTHGPPGSPGAEERCWREQATRAWPLMGWEGRHSGHGVRG